MANHSCQESGQKHKDQNWNKMKLQRKQCFIHNKYCQMIQFAGN